MKKYILLFIAIIISSISFINESMAANPFGPIGTTFIGMHGHTFHVVAVGSEIWIACENGSAQCVENCICEVVPGGTLPDDPNSCSPPTPTCNSEMTTDWVPDRDNCAVFALADDGTVSCRQTATFTSGETQSCGPEYDCLHTVCEDVSKPPTTSTTPITIT
ncbi:MAG: hypothetical protein QM490_01750, partial [Candidatus Gracilibacteria bacterium]